MFFDEYNIALQFFLLKSAYTYKLGNMTINYVSVEQMKMLLDFE